MEADFSSARSVRDALTELSLNMRWSWNHAADSLWSQLDPELWELTRNPCAMLQTVSEERLASLSSDPQFRKALEEIYQRRERREQIKSWFERAYTKSPFTSVAYFSMEYMLNDALPIY